MSRGWFLGVLMFVTVPLGGGRLGWGEEATPTVRAQLQPSTAKLGDLLTLDIRLAYPNGFTAEAPALQKKLGTFEVYASTAYPAKVEGSQTVLHLQAQLQNFTTGPQTLPGIELRVQDMRGETQLLKTPELQVAIGDQPRGPKDKNDIRGIKGPFGPVAWSIWWWLWLAAALVGGGVFFWHRRQRVLHGPPPPPAVPPDEEALDQLQRLLTNGLIEAGKLKEFYSGISEAVRGYLEKAYRIPALERTTSELVRDLGRRNEFDHDMKILFRELFDACDLVKFAKFRPDAAEALKDHALAVQAVEKTRVALKRQGEKHV